MILADKVTRTLKISKFAKYILQHSINFEIKSFCVITVLYKVNYKVTNSSDNLLYVDAFGGFSHHFFIR